jgi:hypothetical protein
MKCVPIEKLYVALSVAKFGKVRELMLLWKYDTQLRGIRKKGITI